MGLLAGGQELRHDPREALPDDLGGLATVDGALQRVELRGDDFERLGGGAANEDLRVLGLLGLLVRDG